MHTVHYAHGRFVWNSTYLGACDNAAISAVILRFFTTLQGRFAGNKWEREQANNRGDDDEAVELESASVLNKNLLQHLQILLNLLPCSFLRAGDFYVLNKDRL